MKNFKACPFCGGKLYEKYSGLRDRLDTTTNTFSVSECTNCEAALLNPMPIGDVSSIYPSNYLSGEKAPKSQSFGRFDLEKWYRYNQYKYDFKLFKRASGLSIKNAKSYLDIGCGSGERVAFVKDQGCKKSSGVDKFDFAKENFKYKLTIINSGVLDYSPREKFQTASLFHVMEHVENPREILEHIRTKILLKGGYLLIQVPNYDSLERRVFKRKWFCFDAPRHIWQFNQKALTDMLNGVGYKVNGCYKTNAPLHPVTIVPSLSRELDIQRIWVNCSHGIWYRKAMTIAWSVMTIVTIPLTLIQNVFRSSSMLTIVALNE